VLQAGFFEALAKVKMEFAHRNSLNAQFALNCLKLKNRRFIIPQGRPDETDISPKSPLTPLFQRGAPTIFQASD